MLFFCAISKKKKKKKAKELTW